MAKPRLGKPDPHLEEEDAPLRTTPQGTQEYGVVNGHEERDVNFRSVIGWFAALGVSTVVIIGVLFGMFRGLEWWQRSQERLPSPLFAQRQEPPLPRLLPNPVDARLSPRLGLLGPIEYHDDVKKAEDVELLRMGLLNKDTGLPELPAQAVADLTGAPAAGAPPTTGAPEDALRQAIPADSSGGTTLEDRLR